MHTIFGLLSKSKVVCKDGAARKRRALNCILLVLYLMPDFCSTVEGFFYQTWEIYCISPGGLFEASPRTRTKMQSKNKNEESGKANFKLHGPNAYFYPCFPRQFDLSFAFYYPRTKARGQSKDRAKGLDQNSENEELRYGHAISRQYCRVLHCAIWY